MLIEVFQHTVVNYQHIDAGTKWPPFRRRHFQMHILEKKIQISIKISLKYVLNGPITNFPAPARRQATICTNDGQFTEAYMRQSASLS